MDKFLRPERFEADPNSSESAREWKHWYKTFDNFLRSIEERQPDKLNILINYVSSRVYEFIADCSDYDSAIASLVNLYVKPKNEVFARHILATRKQQSGESLDGFLQALKQLSNDCNFKSVSAEQYKEEAIRDAFIGDLRSAGIRQRLLENKTLELQTAYDQALALDLAQKSSESYSSLVPSFNAVTVIESETQSKPIVDINQCAAAPKDRVSSHTSESRNNQQKCYFCGNYRHPRSVCPARLAKCNKCGKQGRFAKVCRGSTVASMVLATASTSPHSLSKTMMKVTVNDSEVDALVDTGSTDNYISLNTVNRLKLSVCPGVGKVTMATTAFTTETLGFCQVDLVVYGSKYENVRLSVLPNLCSDVILGHEFLNHHDSVQLNFGGTKEQLCVCGMTALKVTPPSPFVNLKPECKPVVTKSRRYNVAEQQFIGSEIRRMLAEGIIESSTFP